MIGAVAAGSKKRAAGGAAPTIESLWADYGVSAVFWFDASGLHVGNQTLTDRVASYVTDDTNGLAAGTINGVDAWTTTTTYAYAATMPTPVPCLIVAVMESTDATAAWYGDDDGGAEYIYARLYAGDADAAVALGGTDGFVGPGAAASVAVITVDYDGSTVALRANGAALGSAAATGTATGSIGAETGGAVGSKFALFAALTGLTAPQKAALEADLLTIMGL